MLWEQIWLMTARNEKQILFITFSDYLLAKHKCTDGLSDTQCLLH